MENVETRLDENDKALERMKQERSSPGSNTKGGDAAVSDSGQTAPRRGLDDHDQPATVVTPPQGN